MKVKCTGYKSDERLFTVGKVYEWDENSFISDDGHNYNFSGFIVKFAAGTDPKKWKLSRWYNFEVVNDSDKIVITTDGTTTTAKLYDGKKVVRSASAKCSPDDTFDFETGAKLAMERLAKKEKFVPHLVNTNGGEILGNIGDETNYIDRKGNKLFVGDVVQIRRKYSTYDCVVCEDDKGAFVMGIRIDCDSENGKIKDWKVTKMHSFEDIKDGEIIGDDWIEIEYIKSKK